jgi:hypothetical protein
MENIITHLATRNFYPERYSGVMISSMDNAVTFLLWNLSGQCVGYQTYRPDGSKERNNISGVSKYYLMPGEENPEGNRLSRKRIAVFGLETYDVKRPLYVTEGVFDAATLHALGLSAIAVLANDPKKLHSWFSALPNKIIVVADGDRAGKKLCKMGDVSVSCPDGEDPSSMGLDKLRSFLKQKQVFYG